MKRSRIIYFLEVEDIQTVALDTIERELSSEEIKKIIPSIEEKINWFDAIADAINENIEQQEDSLKLKIEKILQQQIRSSED